MYSNLTPGSCGFVGFSLTYVMCSLRGGNMLSVIKS